MLIRFYFVWMLLNSSPACSSDKALSLQLHTCSDALAPAFGACFMIWSAAGRLDLIAKFGCYVTLIAAF